MRSQIIINSSLSNPFSTYSFNGSDEICGDRITKDFEAGKVILIEGVEPECIDFFLSLEPVSFPGWVPPIFDSAIMREPFEKNLLNQYYPRETVEDFKKILPAFQESWFRIHSELFPFYDFSEHMWSWRMNKMALGFLHFDIPKTNFPEHQIRAFINLSNRPRILEIGPTLEELVKKLYIPLELERFFSLPNDKFITAIKENVLMEKNFEDLYLPRHVLRLAPKAIWICNAFLITHGLVFGEKTVCLESRILPTSLLDSSRSFSNRLKAIRENPCSDAVADFALCE